MFVLDPTSEDGKELVEYVKLFLDHLVPARFGLLLVPQETSEVGVALCRGFSYLSVHESPRQALTWLYKVMNENSACVSESMILNFAVIGSEFISNGQPNSGRSCSELSERVQDHTHHRCLQ